MKKTIKPGTGDRLGPKAEAVGKCAGGYRVFLEIIDRSVAVPVINQMNRLGPHELYRIAPNDRIPFNGTDRSKTDHAFVELDPPRCNTADVVRQSHMEPKIEGIADQFKG